MVEELKKLAKAQGLWNLFLPPESGLTNLEYAPAGGVDRLEHRDRPEALNCAAPDTGNMETLHLFATEEQRKQWLEPLLAGEIRSAFSMTEPAVASSDARNIQTAITRDGDDYIINGRKWWTSGANDPRCKILIVMGRTNPDAASHQQQSMILVPIDTRGSPWCGPPRCSAGGPARARRGDLRQRPRAGVEPAGRGGHGLRDRPGPAGPGPHPPLHARDRVAERALALMVERARTRIAFGKPLAEQGMVQHAVAVSRNEIDQARLLCHKAAWTIDQHGNKEARNLVAQIKAVAPQMTCNVIDRAIQVHGGAGVSDDFPLARCTAGSARCGSSTAPTRCTCAASPAPNSAPNRARWPRRRSGGE